MSGKYKICNEKPYPLGCYIDYDKSLVVRAVFEDGKNVVVLIGGAYGFDDFVREKADFVWSFSRLVFPHQIFRTMVVEQIYRASQIAAGRPYHHE